MKRVIVAILAIAVLSIGAIVIFAQRSGHGGKQGGPGQRGAGMMFRHLDLTDEQKTQAKAIMEAGAEKNKPLMEALKANHEKMKAATANGAFDEATVTAIATEQGQLTAQMIVEKHRAKSQVFALLSDEQKAKAAEAEDRMGDRMHGGGFKGGRGKRGDRDGAEF